MKILAPGIFVLGLFTLPAAAQAACTELSSLPATISTPGDYCLAGDYLTTSATERSIVISSSDVTLDCQGHTLRSKATANNGTSSAIYLNGQNNVVIQNCRVVGGYTSGIQAYQSNSVPDKNYYVTIQNNYVAGPYLYGIVAYGSALELSNNRVYDVGGQNNAYAMGIRLGGYTNGFRFHVVKDNLVAGTNSPYNNAFGIYSDNSQASLIIHNAITGFSSGNSAYRGYGIHLAAGTENSIKDNHILGGGTTGIGIKTPASSGNVCYDNQIMSATRTSGCDASLGNY